MTTTQTDSPATELAPTLTDQLTRLAALLAGVQDQKAGLEEHEKNLKAQIRALVPGPDTYQAGGVAIQVSPNRRFSQAKAMAVLNGDTDLIALMSTVTTAIDKDKIKALLPTRYDECFDEGEYRVGLK